MSKTIKFIFTAIASLLLSTPCIANGTTQNNNRVTNNNNAAMDKKGKTLVVFFSHAGDNYAVGNIEVGNTKIVADYISEYTGAEQFEIVTHKYDGMAYTPLINLAKEETRNGELPPYEGTAPDLSQFDTVFIGGPIWWGTYPQVMFTFFKENDLNGKKIIPFVTHEGSGLASTVDDLKRAYPNADVARGFAIYGHEVRSEKAKVVQWLKGLGY